jgi:hypothetical protein
MIAWATLAILLGLLSGRLILAVFYSALLASGWLTVKVASQFRNATPERTVVFLGRAYILQGWLFLLWIALGIISSIIGAHHSP